MKYRIGRRKKLALLKVDGTEVVVFKKGQEGLAELVCLLLNDYEKKLNSASAKIWYDPRFGPYSGKPFKPKDEPSV